MTLSLGGVVRFLLFLLLLPFLILSIFVAVGLYFFLVYRPVLATLRSQPRYWYTWCDVRRMTKKRSYVVLYTLLILFEQGMLECQPRGALTQKRLRKHYLYRQGNFELIGATPTKLSHVPFFSFRLRRTGGGLRWRPLLRARWLEPAMV